MVPKQWINNYKDLNTSTNRGLAFDLINSALDAINTETVIQASVRIEGDTLFVKNQTFDLQKFKKIKVLGFG